MSPRAVPTDAGWGERARGERGRWLGVRLLDFFFFSLIRDSSLREGLRVGFFFFFATSEIFQQPQQDDACLPADQRLDPCSIDLALIGACPRPPATDPRLQSAFNHPIIDRHRRGKPSRCRRHRHGHFISTPCLSPRLPFAAQTRHVGRKGGWWDHRHHHHHVAPWSERSPGMCDRLGPIMDLLPAGGQCHDVIEDLGERKEGGGGGEEEERVVPLACLLA
jgi:hypothetical protein